MYIMYIHTQVQEVSVKICFQFEYSTVDGFFLFFLFFWFQNVAFMGRRYP